MSDHSDQAAGEGWEDHLVGAKAIKLYLLVDIEQKTNKQKVHIHYTRIYKPKEFCKARRLSFSPLASSLLLRYVVKFISFKRWLIWLPRRSYNSLMVSQLW